MCLKVQHGTHVLVLRRPGVGPYLPPATKSDPGYPPTEPQTQGTKRPRPEELHYPPMALMPHPLAAHMLHPSALNPALAPQFSPHHPQPLILPAAWDTRFLGHDTSLGGWESIVDKPSAAALDVETVFSLLCDANFRPGARPARFDPSCGCWIFKEGKFFVRPTPPTYTLPLHLTSYVRVCPAAAYPVQGRGRRPIRSLAQLWRLQGSARPAPETPGTPPPPLPPFSGTV